MMDDLDRKMPAVVDLTADDEEDDQRWPANNASLSARARRRRRLNAASNSLGHPAPGGALLIDLSSPSSSNLGPNENAPRAASASAAGARPPTPQRNRSGGMTAPSFTSSTSTPRKRPAVAALPQPLQENQNRHVSVSTSTEVEYIEPSAAASLPSSSQTSEFVARKKRSPAEAPHRFHSQQPQRAKQARLQVATAPKAPPPDPMTTIFEFFPDVDPKHAEELFRKVGRDVSMTLSYLSDGKYPRTKQPASMMAPPQGSSSSSTASTNWNQGGGGLTIKSSNSSSTATPKYDYLSPSSFTPSVQYRTESQQQIRAEFPFLSQRGCTALHNAAGFHYSIVRETILNAIMGKATTGAQQNNKNNDQQERAYYAAYTSYIQQGNRKLQLNADQKSRLGESWFVLKTVKPLKGPAALPPVVTDAILKDEVVYTKQKFQTWLDDIKGQLQREAQRKLSQNTGTALECSCCYEQVDISEMVSCKDEGHLFCIDCLKSYAESQIFSSGNLGLDKNKTPRTELACPHGDGCDSTFSYPHLQKALPAKTLEKYNTLQARAVLEQAGLGENMATCPKCAFQAYVAPDNQLFECPVEGCQFVSCRHCGKESHIPLRCDEVETHKEKQKEDGRLRVEEAISAAKIRSCPRCRQSFIKSDGCNKMYVHIMFVCMYLSYLPTFLSCHHSVVWPSSHFCFWLFAQCLLVWNTGLLHLPKGNFKSRRVPTFLSDSSL